VGQAREQGPEFVGAQMGPQKVQIVVGEDPLLRALRLTMVLATPAIWVNGHNGQDHQFLAGHQPPTDPAPVSVLMESLGQVNVEEAAPLTQEQIIMELVPLLHQYGHLSHTGGIG